MEVKFTAKFKVKFTNNKFNNVFKNQYIIITSLSEYHGKKIIEQDF